MGLAARRIALAAAALLVGCGGGHVSEAPSPGIEALVTRTIGGLATVTEDASRSSACEETFGPYVLGFGVRGLTCSALSAFPLGDAVAGAGTPVFLSGPHALARDGLGLDLLSRQFGHYNPAFVRQAARAVAAAGRDDPATQALVTRVYQTRLERLARVYWLTYRSLAADGFPEATPPGAATDYVRYLRGGPLGVGADGVYPGFTMTAFSERSRAVPPALGIADGDLEWFSAQYEANTSAGFWLRRREDGTLRAFCDGLRSLLEANDPAWLEAHPG